MPVKPLSPFEASAKRVFPDEVIEAFNELISENLLSSSATVRQDAAVTRIMAKMPNVTRAQVFDRGWLNVEDVYRAEGWEVEYDKPGYNESYAAHFTFTRRS